MPDNDFTLTDDVAERARAFIGKLSILPVEGVTEPAYSLEGGDFNLQDGWTIVQALAYLSTLPDPAIYSASTTAVGSLASLAITANLSQQVLVLASIQRSTKHTKTVTVSQPATQVPHFPWGNGVLAEQVSTTHQITGGENIPLPLSYLSGSYKSTYGDTVWGKANNVKIDVPKTGGVESRVVLKANGADIEDIFFEDTKSEAHIIKPYRTSEFDQTFSLAHFQNNLQTIKESTITVLALKPFNYSYLSP